MPWTMYPGRRNDLSVETYELLDGSGGYNSGWIESDVRANVARVAVKFNGGTPTVTVEEALSGGENGTGSPEVIRSHSVPVSGNRGYLEVPLTCRYFRLVITGGNADNPFHATVRQV